MMFAKAYKTCAKTHLQRQIFAPKSIILFDLAPRVYIKRGVLSTVLPNQTTQKTQEHHLQPRHNTANFAHKIVKTPRKMHVFPHTGACFCLGLNCSVEQVCFLPNFHHLQPQTTPICPPRGGKNVEKGLAVWAKPCFCLENFLLESRYLPFAKHLSLRSTGCKLHCFSSHGVSNLHCKFVDCKKRNPLRKWVMSLAENLQFTKSASIAFDRSNANMGYAQTLIQTERANTQDEKS